jgi:hypothetical protein
MQDDHPAPASFTAPIRWMGLDEETAVEIGIRGPQAGRALRELLPQLDGVSDLEVHQYGHKGADFGAAIVLVGSVGGIIQGVDITWRWYSAWRQARGATAEDADVSITVRSKRGGVINLSAASIPEARRLVERLGKQLGSPG